MLFIPGHEEGGHGNNEVSDFLCDSLKVISSIPIWCVFRKFQNFIMSKT